MNIKKQITMLCVLIFILFGFNAFAEKINTPYDLIPKLEKGAEAYTPDLISEESKKATEALHPKNILSYLIKSIKDAFNGTYTPFISLVSVILISSVLSVFKDNLLGTSDYFDYITLLVTMLLSFSLITPLIEKVSSYLEKFVSFMVSMIGSMAVLLGALGGAASAAVSSSSAAFITGITQVFSVNVVLPCIKVIVAISAVSALSKSIDLSGVINFVKNFCTWGLGVLFAVFGGVHSAAVKISSGADTLAVRGIRFTAARLIPVAGNMISESLRTVVSGINVIKGASGGLGIAFVLYSLIPAVCAVLNVKLIILSASFCSKLMGQRKHTGFLEGINSALNILLAVCLFSSVSGILIFAVFIGTMTAV